MEGVSREIRLVARPRGFPGEELFEVAEAPIPDPAEGQVLIRNAYFSVDPYMRPRMNDVRSYVAPFTLGEAMTGGAVGRVEVSRPPDYAAGDWVLHLLGWREWALSDGSRTWKVDPSVAPVSTALGVLGVPGFTAYHGLHEIGRPRTGETVFVSGASGAVGSAAGQIAKVAGCRVVGCGGSPQKVEWLRELGFDSEIYVARMDPRWPSRSPRRRPRALTSTSTTSAAITSKRRSARCDGADESSPAARCRATPTTSPGPRETSSCS